MELPIEGLPFPAESPWKPRLRMTLLAVLGIGLGCIAAVAFLLWWDADRRERWEQERLEALADADDRAKAAKVREDADRPPGSAVDSLFKLNEQFHDIYRIVRAERLANTTPVVVVLGDDLVLLREGERQTARVTPGLYHELKAYAHIPLTAYLATGLEPGNTEVPSSRQMEIRKFLDRLPDVKADLARHGFAPELRQRQEQLIDETAAYLEVSHKRAFEGKPIDAKERKAFAEKMRGPIEANVRDAAAVQIKALDAQMAKWRKSLKPEEWKQLKVVVTGSAMPRKDNLAVQYFAWLLGESGEGKRIIYAEGLFDESKALDLLGTHSIDSNIGRAFFDEPTRMQRDLLGDAAGKILEEMTRERK